MGIINYRSLIFFESCHKLVVEIYKVTNEFPKNELYGLTQQIRRASVSVCSNIAEGSGRSTQKEFKRFLEISLGSLKEVEYQLKLSKDLNYIQTSTFDRINSDIDLCIRKLYTYIKKIDTT